MNDSLTQASRKVRLCPSLARRHPYYAYFPECMNWTCMRASLAAESLSHQDPFSKVRVMYVHYAIFLPGEGRGVRTRCSMLGSKCLPVLLSSTIPRAETCRLYDTLISGQFISGLFEDPGCEVGLVLNDALREPAAKKRRRDTNQRRIR